MTARGFFAVFEGCDGSGKGAVIAALCDRLAAAGHAVTRTAEPSSGPVGALIREVLTNRFLVSRDAMGPLYAADRIDHVSAVVEPALAAGETVLCDRYELSNLVYRLAEVEGPLFCCQAWRCPWRGDAAAQGSVDVDFCCPMCGADAFLTPAAAARLTWARGLVPAPLVPDLTLVLAITPAVGAARRAVRGRPDELYDAAPIQTRVAALYRHAAALLPGQRVAILDGAADAATVADAAYAALTAAMGQR